MHYHRWIQITEETAKKLGNDEDVKLLKDISDEFEVNNILK